jgi:hypothetical protein
MVLPSAIMSEVEAVASKDSSSSRSKICSRVALGIWMPTVDCRGCGRSAPTRRASRGQVVGRPVTLMLAGVGLELERRHHQAGMDLRDAALDGELAAFLLEPRAVRQLAFVDLARLRGSSSAAGGR